MSKGHERNSGVSSINIPVSTLAVIIKTQARSIEILTRNEELARNNEELARNNEELARNNEELARSIEELTRSSAQLTRNNEELTSSMERLVRTVEMQSKVLEENKRIPECPTCQQGKLADENAQRMPEPDSLLTLVPSKTTDSTGSIYLNSLDAKVCKISAESTPAHHFIPTRVLSTSKEVVNFPRTANFEDGMSEISAQSNTLEPHFIPTVRSSLIEIVADFSGSIHQDPFEISISSMLKELRSFGYLEIWKPSRYAAREVFSSLLNEMLSHEYIHLFSEEQLIYKSGKDSVWNSILTYALPDLTKEEKMSWATYFSKFCHYKGEFQKFVVGVVRVHNDFCKLCKKTQRVTYGSNENDHTDDI